MNKKLYGGGFKTSCPKCGCEYYRSVHIACPRCWKEMKQEEEDDLQRANGDWEVENIWREES